MNRSIKRNRFLFLGLIFLGIVLRYVVMCLGHNFDFDSYCIVGEISGNFRNVYAETTRYNYAPVFFCIQGLLYRISQLNPEHWMTIYRVLIVAVLTTVDVCIAVFIAKKYSYSKAILFFFNPISIIITGYHNQFDNIAVLFALISIIFFNTEKGIGKKDVLFVVFFTLSLVVKHILFFLPVFILFMHKVPIKKRIFYSCVPPLVFLVSFIPFAISNNEAFNGVLNNVFLYRGASNNSPLFAPIYDLIGFPSSLKTVVFLVFMVIVAWIVRKESFESVMMVYFIAMVAFSASISNQYLVIPMVALVIMDVSFYDKIYMIVVTIFLVLNEHGFGLCDKVKLLYSGSLLELICVFYNDYGYCFATLILLFALIHLLLNSRKGKKLIVYEETL